MMSNSERRDRLQVVIVFSGLWKKSIRKSSEDFQNKETEFCALHSELYCQRILYVRKGLCRFKTVKDFI